MTKAEEKARMDKVKEVSLRFTRDFILPLSSVTISFLVLYWFIPWFARLEYALLFVWGMVFIIMLIPVFIHVMFVRSWNYFIYRAFRD